MSEVVQTPATPAPEQTPSQPVSMTTSEGTWNPEYLSSLPDGLGEHSSFQKYKTPTDYFKGSMNAQKLIGEKAEDFWKSEDPAHAEVRRKIMGIPDDVSEYVYDEVTLPEGMPAEMVEQRVQMAREKFKELGLTKEQAKGLLEWDLTSGVEQYNQNVQAQQNAIQEATAELQKEWKGEKFQYNVDKIKNTLDHMGLDWANDPAFANNPKYLKDFFEKVVPLISDDTIIEARQTQNFATLQDSYDSQWNKMMTMDKNDPNYEREVAKMRDITEKMNQMS